MSSNASPRASDPPSLYPLGLRSRRGSLASLSSSTPIDKEQLAQALDKIHSTACQSETLTTFNEFAAPPPSSSNVENKGLTGDLMQNGLSGLYTRFRGVVGSGKEKSVITSNKGDDESIDSPSVHSHSTATPTSKASTVPVREDSGIVASPAQLSTASSRLESPTASSFAGHSSESQSQAMRSSKTSLTSTPASKSIVSSRPSITPMTKATSSSITVPTVATVNVNAFKNSDKGRKETSENAVVEKAPKKLSLDKAENLSVEIPKTHGQPSPFGFGERIQPRYKVNDSSIMDDSEASGNEQADEKSVDMKKSSHQRDSLGGDGNLDTRSKSIGGPKSAASALSSVQATDSTRLNMSSRAAEGAKRPSVIERITQSHLPGYQASRASSTDRSTVGEGSISTHNSTHHDSTTVDDGNTRGYPRRFRIPGSTVLEGEVIGTRLEQMRKQVLSKEFWMADDICKECFFCGDAFSAFRRKHHCRTCGCIFDSKCTSTISGQRFGVQGSLRVCKTCLDIINRRHDSSGSEDSADDSTLPSFFQSQQAKLESSSSNRSDMPDSVVHSNESEKNGDNDKPRPSATPMMAIPATRRIGDSSNRRSAVLEIDAPQLSRPSSARSLKSLSAAGRPPSGHRRHQSKHNFLGRFKSATEERAPFHRGAIDDLGKRSRLPAFHDDNIIDPDLAPYMSDEESSGDEQLSIFATLNSANTASPSFENDRSGFGSLLSASKKHRARAGEKSVSGISFTSRGVEDISGNTPGGFNKPNRRRNLSATGNSLYHARASPRQPKPTNFGNVSEEVATVEDPSDSSTPVQGPSKMTRSASMRDSKAPVVELNNASLHHVRRLLRQLLQDADVSNVASWEKALVPILLQCTDDVNPDVRHGDDIDIRHYVKLKKIPGGKPGDTAYISGVVFTKNLALKSMPRSIANPRIVIVSFAIEYQRHHQHFMSLDPVIAQEKEFLRNMINRIASLHPQLLLVQKHVSGLALQYLAEANIAVAYNVKPSVIEAVSRCAQTEIISSIDMVALKPVHIGKSTGFDVKTYVHNDIPGKKKTYIYLSGCPKELGCTIALRGASMPILSKMKRITEFMVYVVYNLKLETCLMRDEFVLIPSVAENSGSLSPGAQQGSQGQRPASLESMDTVVAATEKLQAVAKASRQLHRQSSSNETGQDNGVDTRSLGNISTGTSNVDASISNSQILPGPSPEMQKFVSAHKSHVHGSHEDQLPEDVPMPTFYSDMVAKHQTKILSASPFVKFMQPYLLMRSREQERRLVYLKRLRDQDTYEEQTDPEKLKPQKFQLIKPEMVHESVKKAPKQIMEVLHAVHDAEYDKALHNYQTQKRQWENYIQGNLNLFDPFAHQNIAVLYTVVCTVTSIPCAGPELLALAFYNEHEISPNIDPDCTLGQYVEDLCLTANTVCTSNGCERKMFEHHRTYVHGEARITVFVERSPCKIKGLQDSILMWSYCKICKKETQVMPMSESTWKYSLGKYLELSFWSSELRLRAGFCPHDLHRDHLRYFGYHNVAIRIHYDPIDLLEIVVPRTRVTWKVDNDLKLKNELFTKIEERWNRFMISVNSRINGINIDSVAPEKVEACKAEIERITRRSQEEHASQIRKLQEKYMESKYYEIIPLNRAVRAMQEKVAEWDDAFAAFDANFFPSEKDIRRLAALQLKRMFMDHDESSTSLASAETTDIVSDIDEKSVGDMRVSLTRTPSQVPPEEAQNVLASVIEEVAISPVTTRNLPTGSLVTDLDRESVNHLDLAVHHRPDQKSESESPTNNLDMTRLVGPEEGLLINTEAPMESTLSEKIERLRKPSQAGLNQSEASGIPRPAERLSSRRISSTTSPSLSRTQSQPAGTLRRVNTATSKYSVKQNEQRNATNDPLFVALESPKGSVTEPVKPADKKLSDRLGLGSLKAHRKNGHSLIPRSVNSKRKESNVSTLAKHFEQLSREFEKERMRDRKQRAATVTQSRAFPKASSKPIVEVYKDVNEAVEERSPYEDDRNAVQPTHPEAKPNTVVQGLADLNQESEANITVPPSPTDTTPLADETAIEAETDDNPQNHSQTCSDDDGAASDAEHSLLDDLLPGVSEMADHLREGRLNVDLPLDIPRHEKTSLMKMLGNFWAERSASGWTQLDYPINSTDHIFVDSDVIVREDEPSSLISFTLQSEDYRAKLENLRLQEPVHKTTDDSPSPNMNGSPDLCDDGMNQAEVETSLLRATGTHLAYSFVESSARMQCKIFFAEQFDAVRRKCGVADRFVESLSRCLKWDSKGGKTKSVFLKTLDDRFVLKSLSPIETQAFLRFAPAYFNIIAEALFHDLPTVIAKMFGFFQISIKNPVTNTEIKWDVLVMENLFYDRSPTRIFDLKGSMRNRKIQSTGEQNEVLLDENMVEFIYESPLFAREHAKRLLRAAIFNDTLFLQRNDVMDYSLMVAVDEARKELVVGIIDVVRTYTWDKKLESWIKDRGFAGGGRNRPTVTSPKEYKSRFREAMNRYILLALAFLAGSNGPIILAGEGPFLKVFNVQTSQQLTQCRIFEAQTVHGIIVQDHQDRARSINDVQVVIWGGSSLALLSTATIQRVLSREIDSIAYLENSAPDWILDVAICPSEYESCVLATAHNAVLRARLEKCGRLVSLETLDSPSRSILYSANIVYESTPSVLVAAGTVFGEIVVWRCKTSKTTLSPSNVLFAFQGHEGSVFGVNISPLIFDYDMRPFRLLASCSDDRTIRVWDLSEEMTLSEPNINPQKFRETGFGDNGIGGSSRVRGHDRCLAVAMGHASRIWSVKFQISKPYKTDLSSIGVLSFGEDSTTWRWELAFENTSEATLSTQNIATSPDYPSPKLSSSATLTHVDTFPFHSGKHIWSAATQDGAWAILATGGSDGKIVRYLNRTKSANEKSISKTGGHTVHPLSTVMGITSKNIDTEIVELENVISMLQYHTNLNATTPGIPKESDTAHTVDHTSPKKSKPKVLKDTFNRYAFVSENKLLATTTFGRILLGNINGSITWEEIRLPDSDMGALKSYSVIKGISDIGLAFVAGSNGIIYLYQGGPILQKVCRIEGKVADMFITFDNNSKTLGLIVTTLASQVASSFSAILSDATLLDFTTTTIELPRRFVVTSSGLLNDKLVLGSRNGSLAIFEPARQNGPMSTWSSDPNTSGDAITSISALPKNDTISRWCFLTTGRNGCYSIFSYTISTALVCPLHHGTPPFGPMVEAAWFNGSDLLLSGFKSKNFVVWNESKQLVIANVDCGGAHRSYAYSPLKGADSGGYFVYTKASNLHIYSQRDSSHQIVKNGGHGREIKACAVSTDKSLIATGAEDTVIRIWHYNQAQSSDMGFQCAAVIQRHSAGVQHLQWYGSKHLFSSGGNEEFYVWAVEHIEGFGVGVICEASCPDQSEDRDLRVMNFDVTGLAHSPEPNTESKLLVGLAYSDSTFRIYTYSNSMGFCLVSSGRYKSCCIMQIRHLYATKEEVYFITAATDGNITLWKSLLNEQRSGNDASKTLPQPIMLSNVKVHQSSIKTLDVVSTASQKYFVVATGGDDNALGITVYSAQHISSQDSTPTRIFIQAAHVAAITGLSFLSKPAIEHDSTYILRIVSSSNDQRVKHWIIRISMNTCRVDIKKAGDVFTSVADVGDLGVLSNERVLVVGNGMDVWSVVSRHEDKKRPSRPA